MKPPPENELFSAYLDGELTPGEQERIERLLDRDSNAAALVGAMRTVSEAIQSLPAPRVPVDLTDRVLAEAQGRMRESATTGEMDGAVPSAGTDGFSGQNDWNHPDGSKIRVAATKRSGQTSGTKATGTVGRWMRRIAYPAGIAVLLLIGVPIGMDQRNTAPQYKFHNSLARDSREELAKKSEAKPSESITDMLSATMPVAANENGMKSAEEPAAPLLYRGVLVPNSVTVPENAAKQPTPAEEPLQSGNSGESDSWYGKGIFGVRENSDERNSPEAAAYMMTQMAVPDHLQLGGRSSSPTGKMADQAKLHVDLGGATTGSAPTAPSMPEQVDLLNSVRAASRAGVPLMSPGAASGFTSSFDSGSALGDGAYSMQNAVVRQPEMFPAATMDEVLAEDAAATMSATIEPEHPAALPTRHHEVPKDTSEISSPGLLRGNQRRSQHLDGVFRMGPPPSDAPPPPYAMAERPTNSDEKDRFSGMRGGMGGMGMGNPAYRSEDSGSSGGADSPSNGDITGFGGGFGGMSGYSSGTGGMSMGSNGSTGSMGLMVGASRTGAMQNRSMNTGTAEEKEENTRENTDASADPMYASESSEADDPAEVNWHLWNSDSVNAMESKKLSGVSADTKAAIEKTEYLVVVRGRKPDFMAQAAALALESSAEPKSDISEAFDRSETIDFMAADHAEDADSTNVRNRTDSDAMNQKKSTDSGPTFRMQRIPQQTGRSLVADLPIRQSLPDEVSETPVSGKDESWIVTEYSVADTSTVGRDTVERDTVEFYLVDADHGIAENVHDLVEQVVYAKKPRTNSSDTLQNERMMIGADRNDDSVRKNDVAKTGNFGRDVRVVPQPFAAPLMTKNAAKMDPAADGVVVSIWRRVKSDGRTTWHHIPLTELPTISESTKTDTDKVKNRPILFMIVPEDVKEHP